MDLSAPRLGFTSGPGEFYAPPSDCERPPEIPKPEDQKGVFVQELTDRLRWSIIDSPTTAEILELDGTGMPQWQRLLDSVPAFAENPVTQPPRARMLVVLSNVEYHDYWQDADLLDECPAPLVIENPDDQPITIAQFLKEVHVYALGLRDVIWELEGRASSSQTGARLFYSGVSGPKLKNAGNIDARFSVYVLSDNRFNEQFFEENWTGMADRFAKKAGSRRET